MTMLHTPYSRQGENFSLSWVSSSKPKVATLICTTSKGNANLGILVRCSILRNDFTVESSVWNGSILLTQGALCFWRELMAVEALAGSYPIIACISSHRKKNLQNLFVLLCDLRRRMHFNKPKSTCLTVPGL